MNPKLRNLSAVIADFVPGCEQEERDQAVMLKFLQENDNCLTRENLIAHFTAVAEAVKLPIIGCGGVSSAEDVAEMMLAGASAVEVGAANLRDPWACKTIVETLPAVCERLGVDRIAGLTGGAHETGGLG